MHLDINTAVTVPVNACGLVDDTDGKTLETSVAYNAAGMTLAWHFLTCAGVYTVTSVTPTNTGNHLWTNQGNAKYTVQIPAAGGTINNNVAGVGWFEGVATGVRAWTGPKITFRAAGTNDALIDSAYSATQGLAGTNLDATVSSRSTYAGGDTSGTTTLLSRITTAPPTATEISNVVWAAGSRTLTSMGSLVSDIWSNSSRTLSATGVQAIWDVLASALSTANSIGKRLVDNLDTTVSSRSTYAGGDTPGTTTLLSRITTVMPTASDISTVVWAAGSRTLTSFGSLVSDIWSAVTRSLTDKAGFAPSAEANATAVLGTGPKSLQALIELATDAEVNDAGTLITITIDGETFTYVRTPGPAVPPAKKIVPSE